MAHRARQVSRRARETSREHEHEDGNEQQPTATRATAALRVDRVLTLLLGGALLLGLIASVIGTLAWLARLRAASRRRDTYATIETWDALWDDPSAAIGGNDETSRDARHRKG